MLIILYRYWIEKQSSWWTIILYGTPILFSVTQILLLILWFKQESPKYYLINKNIRSAYSVVNKIRQDSISIQNDSLLEEFTMNQKDYDWNNDGRTFSSLKLPKYRRSFL